MASFRPSLRVNQPRPTRTARCTETNRRLAQIRQHEHRLAVVAVINLTGNRAALDWGHGATRRSVWHDRGRGWLWKWRDKGADLQAR